MKIKIIVNKYGPPNNIAGFLFSTNCLWLDDKILSFNRLNFLSKIKYKKKLK